MVVNLGKRSKNMEKFWKEFSKWLKKNPGPMRDLIAWVRERPKLRRRISRRRPDK